jgi:hypothetical protein
VPFKRVDIHLPRWAIVVLVGAPFFMGGLASAAVTLGGDRNQQTCRAVQGVRNDLVTALRTIEHRALSQAKTQKQRDLIIEAYEGRKKGDEGLITTIGNPSCP